MTGRERIARWTDWHGHGLEHLSVRENDEGVLAESVVIGESDGRRFGLHYRLRIDLHWCVREVGIQIANGAKLQLLSDGRGRWTDGEGTEIPSLAGCIDVDIAATPFTNTLPIRRLDLKTAKPETIKVAYVSLPQLVVEPVAQRYTRLANARFRYEGLSTSFSAELEVDDEGIVRDYPGVFRRVL